MDDLKPIDRRHAAYNKAYQDAIREGPRSSSDLDIVIREKMKQMGFFKPERQSPEYDYSPRVCHIHRPIHKAHCIA